MNDCLFCKIVSKEIPSELIFEDDKVISFLDIRPVNKGHALVVPKVHSATFLDTDDDVLADAVVRVKKVAQAIMKATGAAGFNLHVNTGDKAGQTVFRLHFHIIPRFADDGLKHWPHREDVPKNKSEMAEEIKKFL